MQWFERLAARIRRKGPEYVWDIPVHQPRDTPPDQISKEPYLSRYYLTGDRKKRLCSWFNVVLHEFHQSDEFRPHSHPFCFLSIVLKTGYWEHTKFGGRQWRRPWTVRFRGTRSFHWVEVDPNRPKPWTLVFFGPRVPQDWGFLIRSKGIIRLVHWATYLTRSKENHKEPASHPVLPAAPVRQAA